MIDEWIDKHHLLDRAYREIVEECLNESMSEYISWGIIERMSLEASEVVARSVYEEEWQEREQKGY